MHYEYIPLPKFLEFGKVIASKIIADEKKVTLVNWKNGFWVCVGGTSLYSEYEKTGVPWLSLGIVEAVPIHKYTGHYKPLRYHEHGFDCGRMKRPRGYTAMIIDTNMGEFVTLGNRIEIKWTREGEQKGLF